MRVESMIVVAALVGAGCGGDDAATDTAAASETSTTDAASEGGAPTDTGEAPASDDLYSPAISTIVLEVDYAAGAEPYTGGVVGFGDVWDVFANNAEALFAGADKSFEIPRTLDQMELLPDVAGESFDYAAIAAIAAAHRDTADGAETASFYALWLPGYYDDGESVRMDVLGVSFGDTGIVAMFKPVIAGVGPVALGSEKLVEQVTLVHEFGHAVGLVNNGLTLQSPHQDEAHGRHCTNQDCVMYYAVERAQDVVGFVAASLTSDQAILWGDECLADAAAAIAAGG